MKYISCKIIKINSLGGNIHIIKSELIADININNN